MRDRFLQSWVDLPYWLMEIAPESPTINLLGGTTLASVLEDPILMRWLESVSLIYMTDERCVSVDSTDRNDRLLPASLKRLLVPMVDSSGSPIVGLKMRQADLSLVGLGEDGHIASIFPGSVALKCAQEAPLEQSIFVDDAPDKRQRVSRSFAGLKGRFGTALLVSGQQKRSLVVDVRSGQFPELPISLFMATCPNLQLFSKD